MLNMFRAISSLVAQVSQTASCSFNIVKNLKNSSNDSDDFCHGRQTWRPRRIISRSWAEDSCQLRSMRELGEISVNTEMDTPLWGAGEAAH